jgi:hypothetical protein
MRCPSTLAYSSDLPMLYPELATPHANLSIPHSSLRYVIPKLTICYTPTYFMPQPSLRFATPQLRICHTPGYYMPHNTLLFATPQLTICSTPAYDMSHPILVLPCPQPVPGRKNYKNSLVLLTKVVSRCFANKK